MEMTLVFKTCLCLVLILSILGKVNSGGRDNRQGGKDKGGGKNKDGGKDKDGDKDRDGGKDKDGGKGEKDVLELNDKNFDDVINDNDYVLVNFYKPMFWNKFSKEYEKVADTLFKNKSSIKVAQLNCGKYPSFVKKYLIRDYPTLKLFNKKNVTDYLGNHTVNNITNWLRTNGKIVPQQLNDVSEAKAFIEQNNLSAIGFFNNKLSDEANIFLQTMETLNYFAVAITSEESIFQEYSAKNGDITVYRKFDDGNATFNGELNVANLTKFLLTESLPLVVRYSIDTSPIIFSQKNKSVLFIVPERGNAGELDRVEKEVVEVAQMYRQDITVVSYTIEEDGDENNGILNMLKAEQETSSTMRMIKLEEEGVYKPETSTVTSSTMKQFVADFMDNKVIEIGKLVDNVE